LKPLLVLKRAGLVHIRDIEFKQANGRKKTGHLVTATGISFSGFHADDRCSADTCDRQIVSRGYCDWHYRRWRRNGDPLVEPEVKRQRDTPCSIEGCDRYSRSFDLCQAHYMKLREYGDPTVIRATSHSVTKKEMEYFLSLNVEHCLEWKHGGVTRGGYGHYMNMGAHRYVCIRVHGEPPFMGSQVRHLCGNPPCVNPKHLTWGTAKENADDRTVHGTTAYGVRNAAAKLTETQVLQIRQKLQVGEGIPAIAQEYSITVETVRAIQKRKTWKHLE
jgi:hypothetical protein